MNRNFKWGAALMLALATVAAPAFADSDRRGGHRDHDRRDVREARRDDRRDHRHDRGHAHRGPVRVEYRPVVRHDAPPRRHAGPPRWARGGYVHHYRQPVYVVTDYRGYGLRHPPHGHRWMRDDHGDYLLVAVATGLIVDMLLR